MPRRKSPPPSAEGALNLETIDLTAGVNGDAAAPASSAGAADLPARRGPKSAAASAKELASLLEFVVGTLTDLVAKLLAEPALAMTLDEAGAIAEPAANMLMRMGVGKRAAKWIGNSKDGVQLAVALGAYGARVAPVIIGKLAAASAADAAQRGSRGVRGNGSTRTAEAESRRERARSGSTDAPTPGAAASLVPFPIAGSAGGFDFGAESGVIQFPDGGVKPSAW